MSLMLRKSCQELLDANGLESFHVGINRSYRYLDIVGECGQVLVSVRGIQFSRKIPSKEEIKYAVELLDSYLTAHAIELIAFIKAKKKLKDIPVVDNSFVLRKLAAGGYLCVYTDGIMKVSLDTNKNTTSAATDGGKSHDYKEVERWALSTSLLNKAYTNVDNHINYNEAYEKLSKLRAKLSSCDI